MATVAVNERSGHRDHGDALNRIYHRDHGRTGYGESIVWRPNTASTGLDLDNDGGGAHANFGSGILLIEDAQIRAGTHFEVRTGKELRLYNAGNTNSANFYHSGTNDIWKSDDSGWVVGALGVGITPSGLAGGEILASGNIGFRSGTANAVTLDHAATSARTVTLQDLTGTVALLGVANAGGHLLFTDNTYDIGASGATRPRHVYLAGNLQSDTGIGVGAAGTVPAVPLHAEKASAGGVIARVKNTDNTNASDGLTVETASANAATTIFNALSNGTSRLSVKGDGAVAITGSLNLGTATGATTGQVRASAGFMITPTASSGAYTADSSYRGVRPIYSGSVTNGNSIAIDAGTSAGFALLWDGGSGQATVVSMAGGANTVQLQGLSTSIWNVNSDAGTTWAVFHNGSNYVVKNRSGSTRSFFAVILG